MRQSWRDLLFAHWPLSPEEVRPHLPSQLALDTFDGRAWIGLTPFRLEELRVRLLPRLPGVSSFPEVNLRTYVRAGDRPGVYFFSLDADSTLAVLGARIAYRLPYHRARARVDVRDGRIRYAMRRRGGAAELVAEYRPDGEAAQPEPGTLEHYFVERYALYAIAGSGRVLRAEIHHRPWTLRPAAAEFHRNSVARAAGLPGPSREPLLHFSARQDTLVWRPVRVSSR